MAVIAAEVREAAKWSVYVIRRAGLVIVAAVIVAVGSQEMVEWSALIRAWLLEKAVVLAFI